MKIQRKEIEQFFLAALSGLLMTGAFPKPGLDGLAWCAMVPLLFALKDVSGRMGFRLGFVAGMVHYSGLMYWLVFTMRTYGHMPLFMAIPLLFLLAAYLALYVALFSALLTGLKSKPVFLLAGIPVFWTGLEYVRAFLMTGFPWELLGYSQYRHLHLIQISDILGVYGVSFLIALCNSAIFLILLHMTGKGWQGRLPDRRTAGTAGALALAALALTLVYGTWRIRDTDRLAAGAQTLSAAAVQGNIDQSLKWQPACQKSSTEKYVRLSLSVNGENPDLVVWPETAAPFYFDYNRRLKQILVRGVREAGTHFLIGIPSATRQGEQVAFYNSAYLIRPDGQIGGKYHKVHLVPFGEYVPLKKWLPFVRKIVAQVGDFRTGQKGAVLDPDHLKLGVMICYEIIFPDLSRAVADNGAGLLVNITNDAWYGTTGAPYQHFSMAVFRAVENKRSLVRSANTGISGFIDPVGRIAGTTRLFEDAVTTHALPVLETRTFYTRHGDLFAACCLAISLLLPVVTYIRRIRK
ncbi:apolipoprotein N-acyltransferase [Desulfonema ishimotonii]|uniref:Apolipoprotein N-acyltransferase n=1 Tax=Desulfonema ishimotonii TaxID=45657 RepID=A0A401G1I8_9BACT|nr:apolipoprotein N-acyltransferase [Desulfonema ishimotonii]GBC63053.1 apolipoprotein N-acyltransferase [Desulfonema ishimotonii]